MECKHMPLALLFFEGHALQEPKSILDYYPKPDCSFHDDPSNGKGGVWMANHGVPGGHHG